MAGTSAAAGTGGTGADGGSGEVFPAPITSLYEPVEGPAADLVLDAAYLIDTTIEDTVVIEDACLVEERCVTGTGQRRVVRFGSRTGNVGDADFQLGSPEQDNPFWTADSCQGGFDLVGFAYYELLDAATGQVVLTGAKNGFCIRDSEPWELEGGASCFAFNCGNQGISPGCADNYGSELQCQWVDITDVAPGDYRLRVTVNASGAVPELDYSNNVVNVDLQITGGEVIVLR